MISRSDLEALMGWKIRPGTMCSGFASTRIEDSLFPSRFTHRFKYLSKSSAGTDLP